MWCVTGLDWPAGDQDHNSLTLPPSPWYSCWLPHAQEWVAVEDVLDVLIVSSLAEESPQSPAGVDGSAACPPAAAGPANRAVDHNIPCSLYLSTAHQNNDKLTFFWRCWISFFLLSLSISWYTVLSLSVSFSNTFPVVLIVIMCYKVEPTMVMCVTSCL